MCHLTQLSVIFFSSQLKLLTTKESYERPLVAVNLKICIAVVLG